MARLRIPKAKTWIPDQVGKDSKGKSRFLSTLGMTDKDKGKE